MKKMNKIEAYMLDAETLKLKTEAELCEVIEQLIAIIRDQDETIQMQYGIIDSLDKQRNS